MKPQLGPEERQKATYVSRLFARLEIPKRRKFRVKPSVWARKGRLYMLIAITMGGTQR